MTFIKNDTLSVTLIIMIFILHFNIWMTDMNIDHFHLKRKNIHAEMWVIWILDDFYSLQSHSQSNTSEYLEEKNIWICDVRQLRFFVGKVCIKRKKLREKPLHAKACQKSSVEV